MKKGEDFVGISVSYFCHDGTGRYVFNRRGLRARDEQGKWDNGGGGLEFGMTLEETLRKEIKEEYGADVIESEFMGHHEAFREHEGRPTHWLALYFRVLVDPRQVRNCEPHKFDEVAWFRLDEVPEPRHSMLPIALEKFRALLK